MIERLREGLVLVGTAHVAKRSVEDVERAIREVRPRQVLVELDPARLQALQDPERWQQTDILQVLREKKQHLFLLQLYLANMQARIGKETGSAPGAEMVRAVEVADEVGADVVLIDRDIAVTLKRGFGAMNLWQRMRLFWNVWMQVLTPADEDEALNVEDLLETDAITTMTEEFAKFAPVVKTALIDERDDYMASHIMDRAQTGSVVAVVGAGHVPGILRRITAGTRADRAALETIPRRRVTVGKVLAYAIPAFILGAWAYLALTGDFTALRDNAVYWVLVNGGLSALGATLARGHILSIVVAFIAAPLTSLSPALAAGWFAGATEAKMHTPKVADFEAIKDIETLREFWKNGVVRILLVTALANLGSVVGTWLGLAEIVKSLGAG